MEDSEQNDEGPGDPARAFEDLRAEVSVLRRAVEALLGAWEENRPPDYSLDLGRIRRELAAAVGHLGVIEQHPALRLTPAQFGQEIERAGGTLLREAVQALTQAKHDAWREREALTATIATVWRKRELVWWLIGLPVLAVVVTLLGAPVCLGELPFGWNTDAAAAIMRDNPWGAGWDLMQAVNPTAEQQAAYGFNLVQANQAVLAACQEAAGKAGKDQRCTLTIPAQPAQ